MWHDSLRHSGVTFPPPFEAMGLSLRCRRVLVPLSTDAEEMALAWARYAQRRLPTPTQRANFLHDFRKESQVPIPPDGQCDFGKVSQAHESRVKRTKSKFMKSKTKDYYAIVDGVRTPVANAHVGMPGIFVGRGDHVLSGRYRRRIQPEDVTLNLSKDAPVPAAPKGHHWSGIVHDKSAEWLAQWKDPVTHKMKYVRLAPHAEQSASAVKAKFRFARRLAPLLPSIVRSNAALLLSRSSSERQKQLAACADLIFERAMRIGTSGSNKSTFGAATLLVKHVHVHTDGKLSFRFPGKDSVPYVLKKWAPQCKCLSSSLRAFSEGKSPGERLFHLISPHSVNVHLALLHPKLTSKVVRTICVNQVMSAGLKASGEPVAVFRSALEEAALLCNHRSGPGFLKLAPNTTLSNYVDPRLVFAFAKSRGVPPKKLLPKRLLERFAWASSLKGT